MICRHDRNDPDCSKNGGGYAAWSTERSESKTPDNTNFQIEEVEERGNFLIVKAKYPNCAKCAYEGNKVMVFEGVKVRDAIKWRILDPHFRQGGLPPPINTAPPPVARFPASDQGWKDALSYVQIRNGSMIVNR